MRKRAIGLWPGLVAIVIMVGGAGVLRAQIPAGRGRSLDANRRVGSGGRNPAGGGGLDSGYGNRIISGNVGAGKSFKGIGGIRNPRSFQGSLGTSSLSGFLRDSYGLRNNASNMGVPKTFFLPSSTVLGVRGITSGQARPGSNMPSNVNLTPRVPGGPVQGQSGVLTRFAGSGPVNQSLDLRPVSQGLQPIGSRPVVETASNLFGIRRIGPELGLDRPYEEVIKEALAKRRRAEQESTLELAEQTFQALPAWAQPGAVGMGEGQSEAGVLGPGIITKATDESIEQNLAKSRELIEESRGKSGLPSIVDIYEQMMA
ncbi:MAG: hypothetical protein KAT11_06815, partial [Phycisphaerae bacterium]|nr:hypothetical protein [Phycisphaerae bacterium]